MANELELKSFNGVVLRPKYPPSRNKTRETLTIRDAQIIFRNFSGNPTKFKPEGGERTFSLMLDEGLAEDLRNRGWNIKALKNLDDDNADPMFQLPVAVSYKRKPPRIYMVTGDGERLPLRKTLMPEDMLYMMDQLDLAACHMVVAGSDWENAMGHTGKKAYPQSFFGHVQLDELEAEYADVEEIISEDKANNPIVIDGEFFES